MFALPLAGPAKPLRVLCLGAHADDIEIGCGGTILGLAQRGDCEFTWVVFSADERRAAEARCGASAFLGQSASATVLVKGFRDGFFPYDGADIKDEFEQLKRLVQPDVIFTHFRHDRHQDHRVISDLTWNTFRDHLILEYEIPKWDGDFGAPNCFVPLDRQLARRKTDALLATFRSQADKSWFTAETFYAVLRLRGIEAGARDGYAEAFYTRKVICAI